MSKMVNLWVEGPKYIVATAHILKVKLYYVAKEVLESVYNRDKQVEKSIIIKQINDEKRAWTHLGMNLDSRLN